MRSNSASLSCITCGTRAKVTKLLFYTKLCKQPLHFINAQIGGKLSSFLCSDQLINSYLLALNAALLPEAVSAMCTFGDTFTVRRLRVTSTKHISTCRLQCSCHSVKHSVNTMPWTLEPTSTTDVSSTGSASPRESESAYKSDCRIIPHQYHIRSIQS